MQIELKPIVKPPKLPGIFEEIIRFDAETNAQRTNVPDLIGWGARRKRRRELTAGAEKFIKRSLEQ